MGSMKCKEDLEVFLGTENYNQFISSVFSPRFIKKLESQSDSKFLSRKEQWDLIFNAFKEGNLLTKAEKEILGYKKEEKEKKKEDFTIEDFFEIIEEPRAKEIFTNPAKLKKEKVLVHIKNYLSLSFTRCPVSTRETDVFMGKTSKKDYNDPNISTVVKFWDKKNKTEEEKRALDQKYYAELKNINYFKRFGLTDFENQVSEIKDEFNFLAMTYINGDDALKTIKTLEEQIIFSTNESERKASMKKRDNFTMSLCDHIAKMHAFSSLDYAQKEKEDYQKRINYAIDRFVSYIKDNKSQITKKEDSGFDNYMSEIKTKLKRGSKYLVEGLNKLPQYVYLDRFGRNIITKGRDLSSIDFGSIKMLPPQFDYAFAFMQTRDIPKEVKGKIIKKVYKSFPKYLEEYNSFVERKTKDLEKTIIEEFKRKDTCPEEIIADIETFTCYLEEGNDLKGITMGNLDEYRKECLDVFTDSRFEESSKRYVNDIFDFVKSLRKKEWDSYDGKDETKLTPMIFNDFKEGMSLSETYRALIVGVAYLDYLGKETNEIEDNFYNNFDSLIQLVDSSYWSWNDYILKYLPEEYQNNEETIEFKDGLRQIKDLMLKMKSRYCGVFFDKGNVEKMVDVHNHTKATKDGRIEKDRGTGKLQSIEDMLDRAYKSALTDFGISNHVYIKGENWEDNSDPKQLKKECEVIERFKEKIKKHDSKKKMNIYKSIEVDYLGKENQALVEKKVKELDKECNFDYILGSVHRIGPDKLYFLPSKSEVTKNIWREVNHVEFYKMYFKGVKEAIETEFFDYIVHPDVIRKFENKNYDQELRSKDSPLTIRPVPFESYQKEVDQVVAAAVKHDVGFEINVKGLQYPLADIYPSKQFLQKYIDECYRNNKKPKLILGSDSHSWNERHTSQIFDLRIGKIHAMNCGYDGDFRPILRNK